VIEECPSPIDDASLRARMGEAAVRIARAADYVGAGTVEFLVSDATREFYFLEMNTRLQVEHPVTELVTGFDLVREQITVAAGEPLSFAQEDVQFRGHAIECRVYAEDPERNFMPSPGRVTHLRVPAGPGVRDDGGVYAGAEVSIYYDPMISKLAVWGRTRDEAVGRLRRALDEYAVGGIETTLPFFREIVRDPEFIEGRLDTGFIPRFFSRREAARAGSAGDSESETTVRDLAVVCAALARGERQVETPAGDAPQRQSPWKLAGRAAQHRSRDLF
jgi:acetyl-CoA carboxylase biotin carboxylase subunit